jgi:hypothetical protein
LIQCTIEPGHYTGGNLAVVLQESMNNVLTQPTASVSVTFNAVTHKLHFIFDEIYVYNYAPAYEELFYTSPGGFIVWQFKPTGGSTIIMGSTLAAGSYTVHSWLKYCSDVLTADAKDWRADVEIMVSNNYHHGQMHVSILVDGGEVLIPGSTGTASQMLGLDEIGMTTLASSYTSTEGFKYTTKSQIINNIEPLLNMQNGGTISDHDWLTGNVNLSGDLYVNFRSSILANQNHRTITATNDSTFFSMPVVSTYSQLQYHEPSERVWIHYPNGIELEQFEIELRNEHDEPVSPSQDYALELLISQS